MLSNPQLMSTLTAAQQPLLSNNTAMWNPWGTPLPSTPALSNSSTTATRNSTATGNANTNASAGNSLAARMENRQQDVETVAVTSTSNTQTDESHAADEPPSGLDHD